MSLQEKKFWIFDMDGTLTKAAHDFPSIKSALEIPQELDILAGINQFPLEVQKEKHKRLSEIELEIAKISTLNDGIPELLENLLLKGNRIAILTRNNLQNTKETIRASGLNQFFSDEWILTRDHCEPKPSPDGIHILLAKWKAIPSLALMVGDYIYDLECGKDADVSTLYFDPSSAFPYKYSADYLVSDFRTIDI
jgi:HAD superfamily hydrolase (TIGR01549 family)